MNYYSSAVGLNGDSLRSALHDVIDHHTVYPYTSSSTDVWDALDDLYEDPNNANNIILIYSGASVAKSAQVSGSSGIWNREHLWPLSFGIGSTSATGGTDLHHLRPADADTNNRRGNLPFDNSSAGAKTDPEAPLCTYDSDSWEPRDADKGNIARAILYMDVRYEPNDDVSNMGDLSLSDSPSSSAGRMGYLTTLLEWNRAFPPDEHERMVNDRIYKVYQHNRNPFIDVPEWADMVFTGMTPYEAWRHRYFTVSALAQTSRSAATADYDQDGWANLLEYKLRAEPMVREDRLVTCNRGSGTLTISHSLNRLATDATLTYETSTDLVNWTASTPASRSETVQSETTSFVTVLWNISANPRMFVRLKVER